MNYQFYQNSTITQFRVSIPIWVHSKLPFAVILNSPSQSHSDGHSNTNSIWHSSNFIVSFSLIAIGVHQSNHFMIHYSFRSSLSLESIKFRYPFVIFLHSVALHKKRNPGNISKMVLGGNTCFSVRYTVNTFCCEYCSWTYAEFGILKILIW